MKNNWFGKVCLMLAAIAFADGEMTAQNRADVQSLYDGNSFTMILLGDPQGYTKYDINQPIFELCTAWIADNIDRLNIKGVLCTGDLVEQNDNIVMNRKMLNQTSREMWESASRSMARLDNKVPYFISPGNHDYGFTKAENGNTEYPSYFPFERNSKWRETLVSGYPSRTGKATLENSAHIVTDKNWGRLLIVTTEFAPRDEVLEWAGLLTRNPAYKDCRKIFMTHSYLKHRTAEYTDNEKYLIKPRNYGREIWEKCISKYDFDMVICGHTGKPHKFEDSVAYRIDKNSDGKNVHQMMFNIQTLGGGWEGNGGDGWLRILEFMPDGKTVRIRTYSPLFGISPSTRHLAHRDGKFDRFSIVLD